jgi:hypothetical protein
VATKKVRKLIFFKNVVGSGIRGIKIRIQNKHPGSATLVEWEI